MTINLLMTLQVSVVLNIFLFIWLILAERARLYWKTHSEERETTYRVSRDYWLEEGRSRSISQVINLQEELLEQRRNLNNHLLDLLLLALEEEDLKPHLDLIKDAIESDDED